MLLAVLASLHIEAAQAFGTSPLRLNLTGYDGPPVQPKQESDSTSFPAWALGPILGVGIPLALLLLLCCVGAIVLLLLLLLKGRDDDDGKRSTNVGRSEDFGDVVSGKEKSEYRAGRGAVAAGSTATATQTGLGTFDIDLSKEAENVAADAAAESVASPRRKNIGAIGAQSNSLRDYRDA
jgi:hypothetical protein